MSILSAIWSIGRAYQPASARKRDRDRRARRFGAFKPTYAPPAWHRKPRTDREAQRMYNHIRTVAFYLDAAPALSDLGIPFRAGLDDIISLVPLYGDLVSAIFQLYQVMLCLIFGVPAALCMQMVFNVIFDVLVGIVPIIGDILDNLFKSNLRNLAILERWLLEPSTDQYHILLMPDSDVWLPEPKAEGSRMRAWFGLGASEENEERDAERATGVVKRTRRMRRDEAGYPFRATAAANADGYTPESGFTSGIDPMGAEASGPEPAAASAYR